MAYQFRTLDSRLDDLLPLAPAIAIDGAKGIGKTETALRRAERAWLLDDPAQRELLAAQANFNDIPPGTLLIDEWQRLPEVWDSVRRHVDSDAPPGRFLLTGSASASEPTHSGAGRILSLRMRPMGLHERGIETPSVSLAALLQGSRDIGGETQISLSTYLDEITRSGFPGIRNRPALLRRELLDAYLQRIVDRDLPEMGVAVRRPETLRRWMAAYAAATSTTTAYSKILDATTAGDGSQPAKTTTIAYRDHLTKIWQLDPLPGWAMGGNPFTALQVAPKHHLADPALAARLLNLTATNLQTPRGASMTGPLFEALTTLTVRAAASASYAEVGHLRTNDGRHEVDLIAEGPNGEVLAIEVKLAASVTDSDVTHLKWLQGKLGDSLTDMVVITTGARAYRRSDGIAVVPLALLGA